MLGVTQRPTAGVLADKIPKNTCGVFELLRKIEGSTHYGVIQSRNGVLADKIPAQKHDVVLRKTKQNRAKWSSGVN